MITLSTCLLLLHLLNLISLLELRGSLDREEIVLLDDLLVFHAGSKLGESVDSKEMFELFDEKDCILFYDLASFETFSHFQTFNYDGVNLIEISKALTNVDNVDEKLKGPVIEGVLDVKKLLINLLSLQSLTNKV